MSDINVIMNQLPVDIDRNLVSDVYHHVSIFKDNPITKQQLTLLSYIFKDIIDPRGLVYISSNSMVNLLAAGFGYLWALDCKYMAVLLVSIVANSDDSVMTINTTVNRTRLSKDIKDELMFYYPYTRVINATTDANLAEEAINTLANEIYTLRWESTLPNDILDVAIGGKNNIKSLPADLKTKLAEMVIKLEKNRK